MIREGTYAGDHDPRSVEELDRRIEELLLSGERCGEGGKAVIIKISSDHLSPELQPAFNALSGEEESGQAASAELPTKAVKLFKLYLPNKGKNEYEMHRRTYDAIQEIPETERNKYANVPKLSSSREVVFDDGMRQELERQFALPPLGERSQLITMEYVNGEDLATIFYKWILEREGFAPERTDDMDFVRLYEELSIKLHLETFSREEGEIPENVADLAEWKNSVKNTEKIYAYLRKNNFPMAPDIATRVENTLTLMHRKKITHGDAFERNIMVTGGTKSLREKGTLQGEDIFLIDFGEARDHFVEGVDDFKVVRRLKTLSISRNEELKMKEVERFAEITAKASLLRETNAKWQRIYKQTKELAVSGNESSSPDGKNALAYAWRNIVPDRDNAIEDFVIIAKDLAKEGLVTKDIIAAFVKEKEPEMRTPFTKALLRKCVEWLNILE